MSITGNVFSKQQPTQAKSSLDNIRESLYVGSDGSVSFKSTRGRGSGSGVKIDAENFDEFVSILQDVATRREELAAEQSTVSSDSSNSEEE